MWSGSVDALAFSKTHKKIDININTPAKCLQQSSAPLSQYAGFSLLEVLVAFVIMGLVVTGILQLVGNSLRSVALADEYSYAVQIAESKLASVGSLFPVAIGSHTGTLQDKFNWRITIENSTIIPPDTAQIPSAYPYLIRIEITWPLDNPKRNFQLASIRFGKAP
jgi:general secretion pathway protein I